MKLLLSFAFLLAGLITSDAQTVARKLDSYNDKIHGSEAEQWHLEDFRKSLVAEPDSKAYIIAYAGRADHPGKSRRYAWRARNYLVEMRGIQPERIVSIDGGRREEFIVELWLAPNSAQPPKPTPTLTVPDDLGDNLLYDDFDLGYDNFASRTEDEAARLDGFAMALKTQPNSWGCILAYAEAGDDRRGSGWDPPGTGLRIAREQQRYLVTKHHLLPSKISVIDGGYGGRVVDLWVMRPNARFDNGPFLYPNRLKTNQSGALTINNRNSTGLCCKACLRGRTDRYILKDAHRRRVKPMRGNRTTRWIRSRTASLAA